MLKFSREFWNSRDCLAHDAHIFGANDRMREMFGKWVFYANFDVHATVYTETLFDAFGLAPKQQFCDISRMCSIFSREL